MSPILANSSLEPSAETDHRLRPVSIVAPMYNEADCVDAMLDSLSELESLLTDSCDLEFLLVDDGSTDGTSRLVSEAIADRPHYRLVRHDRNRGVSAAIFTGIAAACSPVVASIDADGSYDLSILQGMLPITSPATPMVTASPYHPLGRVEGAPRWRVALSRAASRVYAWVMPQRLDCYTACFRTYERESVLGCVPENDGFTGVAELAWKIMRCGGEVAEYPAVLRARAAGVSKMKVTRTMASHARLISRIAAVSLLDRLLSRRPTPKTTSANAKTTIEA